MTWTVLHAKALDALRAMDDNSFDSIVTDPPYGLSNTDPAKVVKALTEWITGNREFIPDGRGFMGKKWDEFVPPPALWDEVFRVLKPGGYVLCFAGSRTHGLMEISLRLAGFDIRDSLHWIYGSGFPKSRDISKAIDSEAGAEREVIGKYRVPADSDAGNAGKVIRSVTAESMFGITAGREGTDITAPATEAAKKWDGWGTALKPSHEPIILARKPLAAKTVAANVLEYGTGAINVDGCRVGTDDNLGRPYGGDNDIYGKFSMPRGTRTGDELTGRWPPNILLSHSPYCEPIRQRRIEDPAAWACVDSCPVAEMDRQSGITRSSDKPRNNTAAAHNGTESMGKSSGDWTTGGFSDTGGASRFFPVFKYQAKAAKKERPAVEGLPGHPTVKPLELMRWLAKLVTQPGGKVLDPFAGSGTTGEACELEGFDSTLIEQDGNSVQLINKRMSKYEDSEVA